MTQAVPGPPVPDPLAPSMRDGAASGVLEALARLEELDQRPVAEHVEVFDGVHRLLQDALATLDEV